MKVKISQAIGMTTAFLAAGLVPIIAGSPGIGKSAIVHQIAKQFNLKVIDFRLSQCDPVDLNGFPSMVGGRGAYVPMDTFPLEGDEIPKGYSGWLLFLDELTSASPAIQAAAYKIILDRMVGQHHLHKKVAIVGAGNLETDNAIVESMSTALQSRLVHMELQVDAEQFCDYAESAGFDHRITDYLKFKPEMVYTFRPDHSDKTYACPRTWEFTNRLMSHMSDKNLIIPMLAGTIGEGTAREFVTFCEIYKSLPKMEAILKTPETIDVPDEPSILYAISGSLSNHANTDNLAQMMKYIKRLPAEFQIITLNPALKRDTSLRSHPEIDKWTNHTAKTFF